MNTTITIRAKGPRAEIKLDPYQTRLFLQELARVRRSHNFMTQVPADAAPDCVITAITGRRRVEYQLFERVILSHSKSKRAWHFYFGVLLLEWLFPESIQRILPNPEKSGPREFLTGYAYNRSGTKI